MKKFKTTLTVEESQRLIELGVDPKMASKRVGSMRISNGVSYDTKIIKSQPIFTLTDILRILPKEIKEGVTTFHLNIDYPIPGQVAVRYIDPDDVDNDILGEMCEELIDALNLLLKNTIKCGYINLNKKD